MCHVYSHEGRDGAAYHYHVSSQSSLNYNIVETPARFVCLLRAFQPTHTLYTTTTTTTTTRY